MFVFFFFFQAEDGIRDWSVTGVQTCALPIWLVLGEEHEARLTARVRTVQAPGGCGALRLGAELIRAVSPDSVVHVSTPTWEIGRARVGKECRSRWSP